MRGPGLVDRGGLSRPICADVNISHSRHEL